MMPDTLKAYHIKRGKDTGKTGEEHFLHQQEEKNKYIWDKYSHMTPAEIDSYLSHISVEIMNFGEYLELINSPHANQAHQIEGDFVNFQASLQNVCEEESFMN